MSKNRTNTPNQAGSFTVLLIEPDILVRLATADYLRDCGFTVIEAVNAAEAQAVLAAPTTVHVLLIEARLGGGTGGFRLAQQVRQRHPGMDVILTAGTAATARKAGELCNGGRLAQPFPPQELLRRINLLRERRRAGRRGVVPRGQGQRPV